MKVSKEKLKIVATPNFKKVTEEAVEDIVKAFQKIGMIDKKVSPKDHIIHNELTEILEGFGEDWADLENEEEEDDEEE